MGNFIFTPFSYNIFLYIFISGQMQSTISPNEGNYVIDSFTMSAKVLIGKTILISTIGLLFFTQRVYAKECLADEIQKVLALPTQQVDNNLFDLCKTYIINSRSDSVTANADIFVTVISKSNLDNKKSFIYEIRALEAKRLIKLYKAKYYILQALNTPPVHQDQLQVLLSLLAFIDTDLENYSEAMKTYHQLENLLIEIKNDQKLIFNFINVADLYNKGGLHREALLSLNKAYQLIDKQKSPDALILTYENIALTYFYLNNLDSLELYSNKVTTIGRRSNIGSIALHRLKYMIFMLKRDPLAIGEIMAIMKDPNDADKLTTSFQLAQAYLEFKQTKQAKAIILKMLNTGDLKDLVYRNSKLYAFLGDIYEQERDFKSASLNYQKSLAKLSINAENQLKADNIKSSIEYFDINDKYIAAKNELSVRRSYLILFVIIAALIIFKLYFLYRNLRIKKELEKVMFNQFNYELSMMSSHEVRRHLANVLGLITVIRLSEDKYVEYVELENALFESVEKLDCAIKDIIEKLNKKITT
jgi:hypothetical protein